jgi:hypothetical protein
MTKNKSFEGSKEEFKKQVIEKIGVCGYNGHESYFETCYSMQLTVERSIKYLGL